LLKVSDKRSHFSEFLKRVSCRLEKVMFLTNFSPHKHSLCIYKIDSFRDSNRKALKIPRKKRTHVKGRNKRTTMDKLNRLIGYGYYVREQCYNSTECFVIFHSFDQENCDWKYPWMKNHPTIMNCIFLKENSLRFSFIY
jgi:hypothetical protein